MRSVANSRLLSAACGFFTLMGSQSAFAIDKYLDLEPPQTKSGLGYGYNSISREFVLRQCVEFAPAVTDGGSGASGDNFKFSSIISNSQLADEMDLSVATKFSASMGVASASTSAKVDFFQSTKTNFLTHTILASYNNVEPMKYIAGELKLKPEYLALVGTPAFRQQCGDYVIIGEQKGRWFYGTVQLSVLDTVTASKLAVNGNVEGQYGTFSAEAQANTINKMKNASNTQDLQIRVTSSGTSSASLTIDQFLAQVKAFPGANGPKQTYKLKAVPIENIVANWPATDPLAPITAEQKLTRLAEAAWGLTALIDDSDFVTQNAKLFALGTTPAQRSARVAHIKARRNWYQSQLDDMRNRARTCDVDWNGAPACESLYGRWKNFEDFVVAEYDQFPTRYVSDCYAPRDAGDSVQDALKLVLMPERGHFSNTKGDREMGGGPVGFAAHLNFKPDFTGGDPLGVRKLQGTLDINMEELKADHTTFETKLKTTVYDLAKPEFADGAPITLGQCAYKGTGVKAKEVTEDASFCDTLKAISQEAYEGCKKAVTSVKYHGILRGKTGEDPRQETFNKHSRGVLSSMRCNVDSDMGNDTPIIGCDQIKVQSVQLDLINTQDLAADAWVAPKQVDQIVIPKGIIQPAGYTEIVKQRTAAARAKSALNQIDLNQVNLNQLNKANQLNRNQLNKATQGSCNSGLVNLGGECLPPLKR